MTKLLSLSFSDSGFQSLIVNEDHTVLDFVDYIYPFQYHPDQFLTGDIFQFVQKEIQNIKQEKTVAEPLGICFTVPFTFAHIKKILLPSDSSEETKKSYIHSELSSLLPGGLNTFKVNIVSENKCEDFIELNVIAFKKTLLTKFHEMARICETEISGVYLNCFSLEKYLFVSRSESEAHNDNFVFVKLGNSYIEYHVFTMGSYFLSYIDKIKPSNEHPVRDTIRDMCIDRSKQITTLIEQLPTVNNGKFTILMYGNKLTLSQVDHIAGGSSIPIQVAELKNIPDQSYKFIESYGSIL